MGLTKSKFKSRVEPSIVYAIVFLVVTFFIFGPLELYFTNVYSYIYTHRELIPLVLIVSLIVFAILLIISVILPKKVRNIYKALLFGISLCFYIQGNFLVKNYGVLDGSEIAWSKYTGWLTFTALVWIVIITLSVLFSLKLKNKYDKGIKAISLFIALVQVVTLVVLFISSPKKNNKQVALTQKNMFSMSESANTVVFVLDAFDAHLLEEILEENPIWEERLEDFTFYHNTTGRHNLTDATLPFLITGFENTNQTRFTKYYEEAYKNTDTFETLNQNNYDANIYTYGKYVSEVAAREVLNTETLNLKFTSIPEAFVGIYKFNSIKYMPDVLKRFFWMESSELNTIVSKDKMEEALYLPTIQPYFYQKIGNMEIKEDSLKPEFKLYHLLGSHTPIMNDENMMPIENEELADSAAHVRAQSEGTLVLLEEYVKQLKANNIYDKTTIIVMADHGIYTPRHRPIFMIKDREAGHSFERSDIFFSYNDFHKVLTDILNGEDTSSNIMQKYNNEERYMYPYAHINPYKQDYLNYMSIYRIEGNVAQGNGEITSEGYLNPENFNIEKYSLGKKLSMDPENLGAKYFEYGAFLPMDDNIWLGKECHLVIPLKKDPKKDLILEMEIKLPDDLQQNTVNIYNDGNLLSTKVLNGEKNLTIEIPKDIIINKEIKLILEFDKTIAIKTEAKDLAPDRLAMSLDPIYDSRQGALQVYTLVVE